MRFHDGAADPKSHAGAVRLGGKERIEDLIRLLRGQTHAGIADRHQADQIFNAFFTTKPHGTGMGLRISRSIIESHDGRLWAADNSPRGGSFYFTLPTKGEANE